MTPVPEARQVLDAKAGNRNAFAELAEQHQRALYGYCFSILRNREAAEDAVQTAFLRALKKLSELKNDDSFRGWLFSIARNVCLNEFRGRIQVPLPDDDDPEPLRDRGPTPIDTIHQADLSELLERHFAKLTPLQREAVFLFHYEELSQKEIAAITNAALGTVRKRVHDGIAVLRKALQPIRGVL